MQPRLTNNAFRAIKQDLSTLAKTIYSSRRDIRALQSMGMQEQVPLLMWDLTELRKEFRYKHVAFCLLRGKKLEQIENTKHTEDDVRYIEFFKADFEQIDAEWRKEAV